MNNPEGYVLVQVKQLAQWREWANNVAAWSTKADRSSEVARLKASISSAMISATQPTASAAGELEALEAEIERRGGLDPYRVRSFRDGWEARAALASKPPQGEKKRCGYCDDTGDVHSIDGEWRGRCTCPVGQSAPHPEPVAPPAREAFLSGLKQRVTSARNLIDRGMWVEGAKILDGLIDSLSATPPAQAVQEKEDDWSVEAAAMKLAEVMDYPWINMPDEGRMRMRRNADAVVRAARTRGNGVEPS